MTGVLLALCVVVILALLDRQRMVEAEYHAALKKHEDGEK